MKELSVKTSLAFLDQKAGFHAGFFYLGTDLMMEPAA